MVSGRYLPLSYLDPWGGGLTDTLRVRVPNYEVSTKNDNYDSYLANPKYPIVRYFGPLGIGRSLAL